MTNFKKYFLILFLSMCFVATSFATNMFADKKPYAATQEETMTIVITINSNSYTKMKNIPTMGFLEVYTILGERKNSLNLKTVKMEQV